MPTVQNVLLDPSGAAIAGKTVTITLVSGTTGGFIGSSNEVLSRTYAVTDATGLWTATLAANSTINPSGSYYLVRQLQETLSFVVPATAGPFWLHDILVQSPSMPAGVVVPAGWGIIYADNGDTITLTTTEPSTLVDNGDGTATLNLAA